MLKVSNSSPTVISVLICAAVVVTMVFKLLAFVVEVCCVVNPLVELFTFGSDSVVAIGLFVVLTGFEFVVTSVVDLLVLLISFVVVSKFFGAVLSKMSFVVNEFVAVEVAKVELLG